MIVDTADSLITKPLYEDEEVIKAPIILCWGRDNNTLLKNKEDENCYTVDGISTYVNPKRVVLQIATNENHTACLTSTGDVLMCGSNDEGQTSLEYEDLTVSKPRVFDLGNHRVTSIAVGLYHTVCVTASGVAISFGGNELGQTGHSANKSTKVNPSKVDFHCKGKHALIVSKACCGDFFSLFLTTTGEVYGVGSGINIGNPSDKDTCVADRIEGLVGSNIIAIAAGSSHALALSSNGEVYAWGANQHGQTGADREEPHIQVPVLVPLPPAASIGKVIGISCGGHHSLIWTDAGVLLGAGSNKYGQLGINIPRGLAFTVLDFQSLRSDGDRDSSRMCVDDTAAAPASGSPLSCHCVQAACGKYHSLLLTCDPVSGQHSVYSFGHNNCGQCVPSSTAILMRQPTLLSELTNKWNIKKVLYIAAGGDQSFLVAPPIGVDSVINVMKKQFSTLASHNVVPLTSSELIEVLSDAHRNSIMVGKALSTVYELFSSSTLLAASFKETSTAHPDPSLPTIAASSSTIDHSFSVDIAGLEACYASILQLGNAAVLKILNAFQVTLTDLDSVVPSTVTTTALSTSQAAAAPGSISATSSDATGSIAASATSSATSSLVVPVSIVRTLLIIWMCPINANAALSSEIFPKLIKLVCNLAGNLRAKLLDFISTLPVHLYVSRLLKPVQEHLSLVVDNASDGKIDPNLPLFCIVMNWMYVQVRGKGLIPSEQFYNQSLSKLPDEILLRDFLGWKDFHMRKASGQQQAQQQPFFISNHPFLLSADAKRRILLAENYMQQQNAQHQAFTTGILNGQMHGGVVYIAPYFILTVNRENLLQTALVHIESASDSELKKPLKVIFEAEEGIDEGGVTKEFFQILVGQLFSPQYGMFLPTADMRSLWINRASLWNNQEFHFVGILLGLAVYNGVLLDIHLPKMFYRKLLHRPMDISDVAGIDPELANGLKQLLEYTPAADVENIFCRTFEVKWDVYGEEQSLELIEGGKGIAVTGDNRQLYVDSYIKWMLTDSIKVQFDSLFQGFTRVVSLSSLLLLSPEELELLMVGTPHLDFKELQNNTSYIGDNQWGSDHPTIQAFWEVIHSLTFEEKQKFLLFVTGSSKAPIGGLAKLGLKIQRMGPDSNNLPTSHTCFNILLLPEYASVEKVRERLKVAISECEGFGLK